MTGRVWGLVAASLLSLPGAGHAQYLGSALDSIFDAVDEGRPAPAVAVAVLHRGRMIYRRAAGYADLERMVPAGPDTRFDWASVAKQFTGFALAQLAEAGALSPEDPARRFIPELDLSGADVTLDQLLRHTSGLEDSDGLLALAGWRRGDAVHDHDVLRVLLDQRHLRWAPGEFEGYGNGGYALLAEIVSRISGMTFPAYADSAVFRRLGMASASFPGSPDAVVPHRALPYVRGADGRFEASDVDTYLGAGGLVATVDDMMRWAAHLLLPAMDGGATARITQPGRLASGEPISYGWGIGLGEYRGRRTWSHGGSGVATESYFEVFPDLDFAVAVASASPGIVNPARVARLAADLVLRDELEPPRQATAGPRMIMLTDSMLRTPPAESEGVRVPAERLRGAAGTYRFEDGSVLVVRTEGGKLEFARDGSPPFIPLFPMPDGSFVMMPLRDGYTFAPGPDGVADRLEVVRAREGARTSRDVGTRVALPPFDAASAAPYVGWYVSDELHAVYQVVLGPEGLELRHARHGRMPLIPTGIGEGFGVDGDRVVAATFSRGPEGVATGMELRAKSWGATSYFRRIAPGSSGVHRDAGNGGRP
ncbi:MAG: hypothetical protein AMXMBFR53_02150 [Gemmatimonadota bacterium]